MGDEIASLMRTAAEAARRLTAGAEEDAAARRAESEAQAKAVLGEATGLLEQARERDRQIRTEAEAYAGARRTEHAALITQATTLMAGLRQVLGDAEQELTARIDQATESRSKLTEMQRSLSELEEQHAQVQTIGTAAAADAVIDLTGADASEGGSDEAATGEPADPEAPPDSDGKLDRDLRDAMARADDHPSPQHEP
jgi:hypothetical protein